MLEELRSLPGDLSDLVGRHLVAAERALEDDDPDQAHEHTKVARRFAARIGVVREAAGIVAYRAGHFSEALSDLRAARRMTGSEAYLPIMADCERGLGRPERAIDLVRSPEAERLDRAGRIELSIVESGARRDLGQHDAAVITLQRLPELRDPQPKPWSARLAFAYADALADAGHTEAATDWFGRAMAFDEDGETDAAERYAELTGAVIEDIEEDLEEDFDTDDAAETAEAAEVDDEAALAEAGDVLDSEAEADLPGDEPEAGELSDVEDVLSGGPGAAETGELSDDGDVLSGERGAAQAAELPDDGDILSGGPEAAELPDDADVLAGEPVEGESAGISDGEPENAEPADVSDVTETGEPGRGDRPESAAEQANVREATAQPRITPAFIEPDFGDTLNEDDEPTRNRPKNDD
ncbi:hypothetical protein ACTMTI_20795 [Nonomuraea sp. H19]|uniref:hypothetical protein n=1 Tax=Nonomuraea sp. H19 TaxID=3452206 RepID=UPI003F89416C